MQAFPRLSSSRRSDALVVWQVGTKCLFRHWSLVKCVSAHRVADLQNPLEGSTSKGKQCQKLPLDMYTALLQCLLATSVLL
eukprot:3368792-Amphidinium_carterae.1